MCSFSRRRFPPRGFPRNPVLGTGDESCRCDPVCHQLLLRSSLGNCREKDHRSFPLSHQILPLICNSPKSVTQSRWHPNVTNDYRITRCCCVLLEVIAVCPPSGWYTVPEWDKTDQISLRQWTRPKFPSRWIRSSDSM